MRTRHVPRSPCEVARWTLCLCVAHVLAGPAFADQADEPWEALYHNPRELRQKLETGASEVVRNGTLLSPEEAARQLKQVVDQRIELARPERGSEPLAPEVIYERVKRSTVTIATAYDCGKCDNIHAGATATGYVIGEHGSVVTNYHVVESFTQKDGKKHLALLIRTYDGDVYPIVEILASSQTNDLAIVRVETGGARLAPVPLGEPARVGSMVYVLSHPSDMLYYFSEGMVSRNYMQTDTCGSNRKYAMSITADYARGSSGGPVLDRAGNVVGTVARTRSIYANCSEQTGLQMVVKDTIPVLALKKLLAE